MTHARLRALAPGGIGPTALVSSPFKPVAKTHFAMARTLGEMGLEVWPLAKDLRLFFGGGKPMKSNPINQESKPDPRRFGLILRKSRITRQIKTTALGRHIVCLRKRCAGDAPGLSLPGQALRPCSRFI